MRVVTGNDSGSSLISNLGTITECKNTSDHLFYVA